MPKYEYRVWDQVGRLETGVVEAENDRAAARSFQERGYLVTALDEYGKPASSERQVRRFVRINRRDLVVFTRELATMINAGLPIVTALNVLADLTSSRALREIINEVRAGIERGGTLSGEMAKYPEPFFEFYVNTVRSGELSGSLFTSLDYLADYLERELDLVQKIRTAATYPVFIFVFTLLIAGGAIFIIVPSFVQIFKSFKVALPLITVIMLRVSENIRRYWWLGILGFIASAVGLVALRRSKSGRRAIDALLLKLPIFGVIVSRLAFARFGRSMGVVIRSGFPILDGLPVVADALGNMIIGDAIVAAKERIRQGRSISESLSQSPLVPAMVVQMIRVGEETGAMEEVLNKVADFYEREVDNIIKRFASIIEPVLIIGVGGVVALVAASVLLPIWSLIAGLPR